MSTSANAWTRDWFHGPANCGTAQGIGVSLMGQLLNFLNTHTGTTHATFPAGTARKTTGDVMAQFSSRGGTQAVSGISKPDITAPGIQILAGMTPHPADPADGPPGQLFEAIAGTSMSSPHIAGAAALIKQLHPTWTPGQIKSALMTTASTKKLFDSFGPITIN